MFNIFKKKSGLSPLDLKFLKSVVKNLPEQYEYLSNQISEDFILDKKVNELGDPGTYRLVLNARFENNFIIKTAPSFYILKDIAVWNKIKNAYEPVELHIMQGMICGFKIGARLLDLDLSRIETKNLTEKHFNNDDVKQVEKIFSSLSNDQQKLLELKSSFKIELPEGVFFTIKNLGDGNYLSVNTSGKVYGLFHDPYKVEFLYENVFALLNDVLYKESTYLNSIWPD
jgi:hypothetical protein